MRVFFALYAFAIGIGLALVESIFLDAIDFVGLRPDLLVLAIVFMSARIGFGKMLLFAFMLGFTRDLFSPGAIGMHAFALTLTAFTLLVAEEFVLIENWTGQLVISFTGTMIYGACILFLKAILDYETGPLLTVLGTIIGMSIYTSALAPGVFLVLQRHHALPYLRLKLKHQAEHETIPENKT
jgi:rod shape-determining protein MreD